jgi:hypothetical protein
VARTIDYVTVRQAGATEIMKLIIARDLVGRA